MAEADAVPAGMALEKFIADQFAALSLSVPDDDIEMMARFVEEDGIEREDKVEGVRGMLEGCVDPDSMPSESALEPALTSILDEQGRLAAAELARLEEAERAAEQAAAKKTVDVEAVLASMTEEEIMAARKAAILKQYAYVEGGPEEDERTDGPPRGTAKEEAEAKKAAEERRRLVEEALKLDGRKKKYKKAMTVDDPLEWNNLNKEKVQAAAAMQRAAAAQQAQSVKNRDKAALEKQRADQAKAKAERQKKAQKQERRG